MPAASARLRNVLSTPKKASPSGASLVSTAWFRAAPASAFFRTFTVMPVCFVKSRSTDFETANESWVTRVTVSSEPPDPLEELLPHAASPSAATTMAMVMATIGARMRVRTSAAFRRRGERQGRGVGLDRDEHAVAERDGGDEVGHLVAHAAGGAGPEVLVAQRPA